MKNPAESSSCLFLSENSRRWKIEIILKSSTFTHQDKHCCLVHSRTSNCRPSTAMKHKIKSMKLPELRKDKGLQEELTIMGSTRRPAGREDRFMAAIFCSVSTAAGTFPADTL